MTPELKNFAHSNKLHGKYSTVGRSVSKCGRFQAKIINHPFISPHQIKGPGYSYIWNPGVLSKITSHIYARFPKSLLVRQSVLGLGRLGGVVHLPVTNIKLSSRQ